VTSVAAVQRVAVLGDRDTNEKVLRPASPWGSKARSWAFELDAHRISCDPKIASFLEDAAAGALWSVSWIDPAFTNFNPLGLPVNDDHPMAEIKDGRDLVLAVYEALAASPQWERSLLVIVYDEHAASTITSRHSEAADNEPQMFGRYGVRVPAIVVSPWIEPRTVSHTLFDHTSIIKTILLRFCPQALHEQQSTIGSRARLGPQDPDMRVVQATHLGELLTRRTSRPAPPRDALVRQAVARAARTETSSLPGRRGGDHPLNELQKASLPRLTN
jgi:hypothetical protein